MVKTEHPSVVRSAEPKEQRDKTRSVMIQRLQEERREEDPSAAGAQEK
jgi:hypothetical protein